jgi:tetratricopeptide (TPR) repeat protein
MVVFPGVCVCLPPAIEDLSKKGEYGQAVEQIEGLVRGCKETGNCSKLLLEKAKLLCKDQKIKEAQEAFLEAIEKAPVQERCVSSEERGDLQSFIPLYLAASGSEEQSKKLEQEVRAKLQEHPKNVSLKYFLAAASATRGDFVSFFDQFYQVYIERPDSYLAWKMRGVLHLRLFEACSEESMRVAHRNKAVEFLKNAFSREPQDASLIAKLVFLLPQEEKKKFLEEVFQDVSKIDIPLQRSECIYLVKEAIQVKAFDVAKKLIGKAKLWYEYSRALEELSKEVE